MDPQGTKISKIRLKGRTGFPLIELVVVVIIGAVAAFGVPRFLKSVERSKAAEAFAYLAAIRTAQERYHARERTYADTITDLDLKLTEPMYFTVGPITAGRTTKLEDSWTLTLTRSGFSAGYGPYTVTFTQDGFDTVNSTIVTFPDINLGSSSSSGTSGSSGSSGS